MTDAETMARIRKGLAARCPRLRAESVDALAALGDVRGLLLALGSHDPHVRLSAVRGLASESGIRVTSRLLCRVADRDGQVRSATASALGRRAGCLSALALWWLAYDRDAAVSYTALAGLAERNWRRAQSILEERG